MEKSVPKLWKSGLTPPPSYFIEKVHNFWTQKKCPKAMDWPRRLPLTEKFRKKTATFDLHASLREAIPLKIVAQI